jgi:hypothetical protein
MDILRFTALTLLLSVSVDIGMLLAGFGLEESNLCQPVIGAARSIWDTGNFTPSSYLEVYHNALKVSQGGDGIVWQDVFALTKNMELFPKHSFFSIISGALFYGMFGEAGFWVLNKLFFVSLFLSVYLISKKISKTQPVTVTLLSLAFGTQAFVHSFHFNYDMHAAALLLGGTCLLVYKRNLYGGAFLAFSLLVRASNLLIALPLLVFIDIKKKEYVSRKCFDRCSGFGIVSTYMLFNNFIFFGSPFLSPYHRLPYFQKSSPVLGDHPVGFSLTVLKTRWLEKLFSDDHGIIFYNLSLLGVVFVVNTLYQECKKEAHSDFIRYSIPALAAAFCYTVYIFSYEMWSISGPGNRFLLPVVFLYIPVFVFWIVHL